MIYAFGICQAGAQIKKPFQLHFKQQQ